MPKICPKHKRNCLWIWLNNLKLQECFRSSQRPAHCRGLLKRLQLCPQCMTPHKRWWWHLQPQHKFQHHCHRIDSSLQLIQMINTSQCQMKSRPLRITRTQRSSAQSWTARTTWRRVMIVKTVTIHHLALGLQRWSHVSEIYFCTLSFSCP